MQVLSMTGRERRGRSVSIGGPLDDRTNLRGVVGIAIFHC